MKQRVDVLFVNSGNRRQIYQPSASTQNMTAAGEICRFVKEREPSLKILMTGTQVAALPEQTMREESVDFVCDREGLDTIYQTAIAVKAGEVDRFDKIPSLGDAIAVG